MKISLYNGNILNVEQPGEALTINDFVNSLRLGTWKILAEKIRVITVKKERDAEKKKILPYVTPAGTFRTRRDADILIPSGIIGMDFDDFSPKDLDTFIESVRQDPFAFVVFRSVSDTGCCVFVKIDSSRFLDSFLALEKYFVDSFGKACDPACKNVSRARFVSYDANVFHNEKAKIFKNYLPRRPAPKPPEIAYTDTDISLLVQQIREKGIDLTCSQYSRYLNIAFGLAAEYGNSPQAADYFHQLVCNSEKYTFEGAEKQFKACARSERRGAYTGQPATMGTIFHYAKEAGLEPTSRLTQQAAVLASQAKKLGRNEEDAAKGLQMSLNGIKEEDAEKIADLVFNRADELKTGDSVSLVGQLKLFLQNEYNLKRNVITRNIENKGDKIEERELNSIYFRAKEIVDEKVSFFDIDKLIQSDFTEDYNPILNFFDTYRGKNEVGLIDKLADSITTDTGKQDATKIDAHYTRHFIRKWLVGIIASAHGQHSPLLLALTGRQLSGKTEWFRRLMPKELKPYYGESKLDAGKDDEILMTQKLLIMDDELGGKSKRDEKRLKELTSKDTFSLREPYGKKNADLKRLAVLCGTSNEMGLLSDPTGNRRIIPINVLSVDFDAYNSIDKIALFMEAFHEYQKGYDWQLNREDVARLNGNSGEFEQANSEAELLLKYYVLPETGGTHLFLTATDIQVELQTASNLRLSLNRLGAELQRLGFLKQALRIGTTVRRGYKVQRVGFMPSLAPAGSQNPPADVVIAEEPPASNAGLQGRLGDF